ncbi:NUDIX domain-containing protein [Kitasatospora sp. NPDC086791]|uniref:NUDIX domain-containing protein n=1 Tax=Kitasatospora sp. NPDC086791 TaxID=3155178 RepID=UPI0034238013
MSSDTTAGDEGGPADFDSVDVFVTNSRHEVLLQLRDDRPDIAWPAYWVVPGGHREPGETPYRTAVRELREETGLDVPGLRPFHPDPREGDAATRRPAFHAVVDVDPAELVLGEGQELRFVPIAEAQGMRVPPDLKVHLRGLQGRLTDGAAVSGREGCRDGSGSGSRAEDWSVIDAVHRHLSEHRARIGQPLLTLQVVKIQEEAGEVAEALLGVLGANPRKGVSHTVADLQGELCDVITAAMVALRDTTTDPAAVLSAHLTAWRPRHAGEPPAGQASTRSTTDERIGRSASTPPRSGS